MNKVNLKETLERCVDDLIKDLDALGKHEPYDMYASTLEYCDEHFTEKFYMNIDPDDLIHEGIRYSMRKSGRVGEVGAWIIAGIMECYDWVHHSKDGEMTD